MQIKCLAPITGTVVIIRHLSSSHLLSLTCHLIATIIHTPANATATCLGFITHTSYKEELRLNNPGEEISSHCSPWLYRTFNVMRFSFIQVNTFFNIYNKGFSQNRLLYTEVINNPKISVADYSKQFVF